MSVRSLARLLLGRQTSRSPCSPLRRDIQALGTLMLLVRLSHLRVQLTRPTAARVFLPTQRAKFFTRLALLHWPSLPVIRLQRLSTWLKRVLAPHPLLLYGRLWPLPQLLTPQMRPTFLQAHYLRLGFLVLTLELLALVLLLPVLGTLVLLALLTAVLGFLATQLATLFTRLVQRR